MFLDSCFCVLIPGFLSRWEPLGHDGSQRSIPRDWAKSNRSQEHLFQSSFNTLSICFFKTFLKGPPKLSVRIKQKRWTTKPVLFDLRAHRSFCFSGAHHPPLLFPPSTFQVPYSTSPKRSFEVQCANVSCSMFRPLIPGVHSDQSRGDLRWSLSRGIPISRRHWTACISAHDHLMQKSFKALSILFFSKRI